MIAGSAMGLRNSAWNTAPAAARAAPTSRRQQHPGSRSWNRITASVRGIPAGRPARCSFQANSRSDVAAARSDTEPKATPASTAADEERAERGDRPAGGGVVSRREDVGVQGLGQRRQPVDHAGPRPGDQVRVDQEDPAVARPPAMRAEPGPLRDRLRRRRRTPTPPGTRPASFGRAARRTTRVVALRTSRVTGSHPARSQQVEDERVRTDRGQRRVVGLEEARDLGLPRDCGLDPLAWLPASRRSAPRRGRGRP